MIRALSAFAVAMVVALAGCGGGTAQKAADPATLAPPSALVFAQLDLAPGAGEEADFEAAFGKLVGADPEERLRRAFSQFFQTSGRLSYEGDMEPWLGDTAGVVVTRAARDDGDFAVLVESKDDDAARDAIARDLAGERNEGRDYRGVSYRVLRDGIANGVVEHYLVAGTEPAFKAVVDAARDDRSLAQTAQWKRTVGRRAAGKTGFAYVDAKGLLRSFASQLPGVQALAAPLLVGQLDLHPFLATLDAEPSKLIVDVSSPGTEPDTRGPAAASSALIERLPGDAWFALALPRVGAVIKQVTAAIRAHALIGPQFARLAAMFRARTGLDVQRDLTRLGDLALFADGTGSAHKATLVLENARASTLRRIRSLVPAGKKAKLAVRDARGLSASDGLGASALFRKAAAALGSRPTLFADLGVAIGLAATSPHHRDDARLQRALPRLRHLEYAAIGARRDGDLDVVRLVVGVR